MRLINVFNRLPIQLKRQGDSYTVTVSPGGVVAGLNDYVQSSSKKGAPANHLLKRLAENP